MPEPKIFEIWMEIGTSVYRLLGKQKPHRCIEKQAKMAIASALTFDLLPVMPLQISLPSPHTENGTRHLHVKSSALLNEMGYSRHRIRVSSPLEDNTGRQVTFWLVA